MTTAAVAADLTDVPLRGRRALITGASRGIGAAIAERLAAAGARVALTARTMDGEAPARGARVNPGGLRQVADRIVRLGGQVALVVADLTDASSRAAIVPETERQLGGTIDILVNNAAANVVGRIESISAARRALMLALNLDAPIELMQAVVPAMRQQGAGWIVNISSGTARDAGGPPFSAHALAPMGFYGASKAALNRMSNAAAAELFDDGIRVNTLQPRAAVATEEALARGLEGIPKSMVEPVEAMADAALILCTCPVTMTGGHYVSLDLLADSQNATPHDDRTR